MPENLYTQFKEQVRYHKEIAAARYLSHLFLKIDLGTTIQQHFHTLSIADS